MNLNDFFNAKQFEQKWNACNAMPDEKPSRAEMLAETMQNVIEWDVPNATAAQRLGIDPARLILLQTGQHYGFSDFAVLQMFKHSKSY